MVEMLGVYMGRVQMPLLSVSELWRALPRGDADGHEAVAGSKCGQMKFVWY